MSDRRPRPAARPRTPRVRDARATLPPAKGDCDPRGRTPTTCRPPDDALLDVRGSEKAFPDPTRLVQQTRGSRCKPSMA